MKSRQEIEAQILKIQNHMKEASEAAPELMWCRGRLQALKWVLKK